MWSCQPANSSSGQHPRHLSRPRLFRQSTTLLDSFSLVAQSLDSSLVVIQSESSLPRSCSDARLRLLPLADASMLADLQEQERVR
jgi:hypothetical protein